MVNLLRIVIIAITIVIVIIINVKVFCWAVAAGGSLIGELAAHTCQEKTRNATIGIGAKINKDQQCQERPTKARIGIGAKSAGWLSGRGIKRGRGGERGVARGECGLCKILQPKCVCPNYKMYLPKLYNLLLGLSNVGNLLEYLVLIVFHFIPF